MTVVLLTPNDCRSGASPDRRASITSLCPLKRPKLPWASQTIAGWRADNPLAPLRAASPMGERTSSFAFPQALQRRPPPQPNHYPTPDSSKTLEHCLFRSDGSDTAVTQIDRPSATSSEDSAAQELHRHIFFPANVLPDYRRPRLPVPRPFPIRSFSYTEVGTMTRAQPTTTMYRPETIRNTARAFPGWIKLSAHPATAQSYHSRRSPSLSPAAIRTIFPMALPIATQSFI